MEATIINQHLESILKLSLQDKIYAYQMLWQSILKDMQLEESVFTDEQKAEIDRRLERIEKGESKLFKWEDVKREIKSNL